MSLKVPRGNCDTNKLLCRSVINFNLKKNVFGLHWSLKLEEWISGNQQWFRSESEQKWPWASLFSAKLCSSSVKWMCQKRLFQEPSRADILWPYLLSYLKWNGLVGILKLCLPEMLVPWVTGYSVIPSLIHTFIRWAFIKCLMCACSQVLQLSRWHDTVITWRTSGFTWWDTNTLGGHKSFNKGENTKEEMPAVGGKSF